LRILVLIASPTDFYPLDVEAEWTRLQEALNDLQQAGRVLLERAPNGNVAELQRRLRRGTYHVFHYIGHGRYDPQAQDGLLALEGPNGRGEPICGADLGALLHDHRTLRLALLNSCEGARGGRNDPYSGTAQSLIYQGIPAVVAMQFEITDRAAIIFTHGFYEAVADGYPLDAAMAEARKAIRHQPNPVEWGTPVLYLRAPDGRIFDLPPESHPAGEWEGKRPRLGGSPELHDLASDNSQDIPKPVAGGDAAINLERRDLPTAPDLTQKSREPSASASGHIKADRRPSFAQGPPAPKVAKTGSASLNSPATNAPQWDSDIHISRERPSPGTLGEPPKTSAPIETTIAAHSLSKDFGRNILTLHKKLRDRSGGTTGTSQARTRNSFILGGISAAIVGIVALVVTLFLNRSQFTVQEPTPRSTSGPTTTQERTPSSTPGSATDSGGSAYDELLMHLPAELRQSCSSFRQWYGRWDSPVWARASAICEDGLYSIWDPTTEHPIDSYELGDCGTPPPQENGYHQAWSANGMSGTLGCDHKISTDGSHYYTFTWKVEELNITGTRSIQPDQDATSLVPSVEDYRRAKNELLAILEQIQ
jgi:hypothetical protein